jgi:hypothetical protein
MVVSIHRSKRTQIQTVELKEIIMGWIIVEVFIALALVFLCFGLLEFYRMIYECWEEDEK